MQHADLERVERNRPRESGPPDTICCPLHEVAQTAMRCRHVVKTAALSTRGWLTGKGLQNMVVIPVQRERLRTSRLCHPVVGYLYCTGGFCLLVSRGSVPGTLFLDVRTGHLLLSSSGC